MRIGIIGQPCIDEIILPENDEPVRSLGGILYSYAAMERLMQQAETLRLSDGSPKEEYSFAGLTWMSIPDTPLIDPLLSQLHHLERSTGLWKTPELTNRVQLVYHDKEETGQKVSERTEYCPNVLPRVTGFQLTPELLSKFDALFINMISGYDVSLETLESALDGTEHRPYVHLDLHALVLGPLSRTSEGNPYGGGREPRGVRKWRRWLNLADSIQMNEFEARWFGDPDIRSEDELLNFIERKRDTLNVHDVIITRGDRGASLYEVRTGQAHHAVATDRIMENKKNSPPSSTHDSPTGCGDVFGSAYIFALLNGGTPHTALEQAVQLASLNAQLAGIEDILTQREDILIQ